MINISALYLSLKRLSEVVNGLPRQPFLDARTIADIPSFGFHRAAVVDGIEDATLRWLSEANLPTLGELFISDRLIPGTMFTHVGSFNGRGIYAATERYEERKPIKSTPVITAKLDSFSAGATLTMQVHPENYTSVSSSSEMSGRNRLFVVGRLTDSDLPALRAQAYVVGHLYDEPRAYSQVVDRFNRLPWQMEVFVSNIDTFAAAADVKRPTVAEQRRLSTIPEREVKTAFAEIIGEPYVPKDWGGEHSDLMSTHVAIRGEQVSTAFAFKGPAKYKPLTVADLGKNGDQISRLFAEPADFLVLQHCHQITSAVRDHMRAFATRTGQLRPFCLLDGADTIRIFKAYQKLGYS